MPSRAAGRATLLGISLDTILILLGSELGTMDVGCRPLVADS
ncbi:hypothetical protein [Streptomyces sp. NPDC002884]